MSNPLIKQYLKNEYNWASNRLISLEVQLEDICYRFTQIQVEIESISRQQQAEAPAIATFLKQYLNYLSLTSSEIQRDISFFKIFLQSSHFTNIREEKTEEENILKKLYESI